MIPPDVIDRLQGTLGLGGGSPPAVEVYYSAENPLKRRYVQATIDATLADANKALSDEIFKQSARYLNLIVAGGGCRCRRRRRRHPRPAQRGEDHRRRDRGPARAIVRAGRARAGDPFARLAADNLDVSKPILASIGSPVTVKETVDLRLELVARRVRRRGRRRRSR